MLNVPCSTLAVSMFVAFLAMHHGDALAQSTSNAENRKIVIISDTLKAPMPPPPLSHRFRSDERKLLMQLSRFRQQCGDVGTRVNGEIESWRGGRPEPSSWRRARGYYLEDVKNCTPFLRQSERLVSFYNCVIAIGTTRDRNLAIQQQQGRILELLSLNRLFASAADTLLATE